MERPVASAIFGVSGLELTAEERRFFADLNPYGYILFARNCESPQQVSELVAELKSIAGRADVPILIDQEGGRVARLKPPHWPAFPSAAALAAIYKNDIEKAKRAVYVNARLIAHELASLGITVDCAPLADLPVEGAHDVIGDRAFGHTAKQVIALARAMADGLMDGGIVPILKHIPGHGRPRADSHEELPVVTESLEVLRATDFVPFVALRDLPMAMTAHVLFTAIDDKNMATVSPAAIKIIREEIGFDGLLMSDDLSMKAMQGDYAQRTRDALNAGCDVVLHCNGKMEEMLEVASALPPLTGAKFARAMLAMESVGDAGEFDVASARAERDSLLSMVA
ncbi:MAG: beta-N-acetylhexosaminidase [Alphaproteobacteria bacterium]|nr:beta-N-acetylhexosaminidase [Alphaproteobacteria bacterium]